MTSPCVSVCVLTYNHQQYISDCIMSVICQANDVSLEILVGDDCSDDETSDIVRALAEKFPGLIRHFRHKTRQVGKNYQFLIGQATGKYIAHLDGDDYWLPGKLVRQVGVMEEYGDVSASYTNALCVSESGELIGFFNNKQPERIDLNYLLKRGNFLNNSSVVYRAEYKKYFIERSPDYIDYAIHLSLACQGRLAYLNIFGTGYRVNSVTSLILNHGEFVRELYWKAIREVPAGMVGDNCKLSAEADFFRRVFFRSLRLRSMVLMRKWLGIVSSRKRNKMKLFAFTLGSILAVGSRELFTLVGSAVNKSTVRVFYWR